MAVDDRKVLAWIDHFQGRNLAIADVPQRNHAAFRGIKDFRNGAGGSTDESLAAAEHYLFARHMVSNGVCSDTQMILMVLGYDTVKFVAQTNSYTERRMRHNPDRPTSKVSLASIEWGLRGADDGEKDRKAHRPDHSVPVWNWDAMRFGGVTDAIAAYGAKVY